MDLSGRLEPYLIARAMLLLATLFPDGPVVLDALVAELKARNSALSAVVRIFEQHIQALYSKLEREALGKASEKVAREIEQLEDLLIAKPEASRLRQQDDGNPAKDSDAKRQPSRLPRVSEQTPRERRVMKLAPIAAHSSGELGKGVCKGRIWGNVPDQRPWAEHATLGVRPFVFEGRVACRRG